MFDKETLTALQEGAAISEANHSIALSKDTTNLTALPSDYKLHDLEPYLPLRRRARGSMTTSVLASFADYTTKHAEPGCSVFVDIADMSATAILNLGTPNEPGHCDNRAKLAPKRTAAFVALLAVATGQGLKQATVAEFLEDWQDHVTCANEAGQITTKLAIAAIRKVSIETMKKLESSEQQLSASKSAFESVQATSADPLPTLIRFTCLPYADLQMRVFDVRLSVQTGGDKPAICLRIANAEKHNEYMGEELQDLIAAQFDESCIPVLMGSYSKS